MFTPTNEQGVVVLFTQECTNTEWSIVQIRTEFPDAILRYKDEAWYVEFEFSSGNFLVHEHDIRRCDMIICWKHNYKNCPVPVICLSDELWKSTNYTKCDPRDSEVEYWRRRSLSLDAKLTSIRKIVNFTPDDNLPVGLIVDDEHEEIFFDEKAPESALPPLDDYVFQDIPKFDENNPPKKGSLAWLDYPDQDETKNQPGGQANV